MARRTYLVQMYLVIRRGYKYLTRWREKYYPDMDSGQKVAVDTAIDAMQALLLLIVPPDLEPDL